MASPHPLGATLPALYLDDVFALRMCEAFDEVLAPIIAVLDCFNAYLDPALAPADMVDWLASWLGLPGIADLPVERLRVLVARSASLYARRGTPAAVRELVELATGRPVELEESGGAEWSREVGRPLPGTDRPGLLVRIRVDAPPLAESSAAPVTPAVVNRLLKLVVPAHIPWWVEFGPPQDRTSRPPA
jgi:phage tail-like protein